MRKNGKGDVIKLTPEQAAEFMRRAQADAQVGLDLSRPRVPPAIQVAGALGNLIGQIQNGITETKLALEAIPESVLLQKHLANLEASFTEMKLLKAKALLHCLPDLAGGLEKLVEHSRKASQELEDELAPKPQVATDPPAA